LQRPEGADARKGRSRQGNMTRSIDVLCEEERIRRLSERMAGRSDEAEEPARERRARSFVAEMVDLEEMLVHGAARRSAAVTALEAGLQARWRAVLQDMSSSELRPDVLSALKEEPRAQAPVPVPSPEPSSPKASASTRSTAGSDPQADLSDALDQITVRTVVGFRAVPRVSKGVEAVAIAVLRLAGTCDMGDAEPMASPKNWDDVRRILLKPGHFVSSLRRYPYAAERGHVSDAALGVAEEALELQEEELAEHETAVQLHAWLRAALEYAAWARARLQDVASPARATRAPQRPQSHESSMEGGGYPVQQLPSPSAYPAELPIAETVDLPEAVKSFRPPSRTTRSASPKTLLRRPPGSASAPTPVTPVLPRASRAGFGVNWASMAGAETKASSSTSSRLQRPSVSGASPQRKSSPSPAPTASSPVKAVSKRGSGASPKAHTASGPAKTRVPASTMTTKRTTVGKSDAARSPSAGSHAVRVPRQSATSIRSTSSTGKSPRIARPSSVGGQALASASPAAPLPSPEDFAIMRRRLDQEKSELKQIRALQSQLKWGMEREEKRQTEEERREEARKIMEWRESQATGMKEYVEEKSREQRVQELLESKDYQEFKREWKQALRTEEIERIREQLAEDMDNSHWQVELQKAIALDRQLALQEQKEAADELRELREQEKQKEKVRQQEDRAHDIALDYAHQASQISAEKEELMRNLQLLRARQKVPAGGGGAGFWH